MNKYFYLIETERFGPVSYFDLQRANITEDTLVWYEGLEDWVEAKESPELAMLFVPKDTMENNEQQDSLAEEVSPTAVVEEPVKPLVNPLQKEAFTPNDGTPKQEVNSYETTESKSFLATAFSFEGRIRRSEYWFSLFILFLAWLLITAVSQSADGAIAGFVSLLILPLFWFSLAVNTRRCHDLGNSGWYQFIPFYGFWMCFADGDAFTNDYGPDPKGMNR
ncbi:DUF805 domain-containing protein [Sphingobacterium sp. MYb382]|uniref:DUF805 domain-containing protein n=1 Tax=Sphingobacterium sp. MYb382 TaxID=2745278 RepID=UPI00309E88EA